MVRKQSPEKRERYLSSALKLFVEKGVQNTTTAAIAMEAGTAAGTLFLYFPTKQDLINELILQIGKEQSEYIQSLLEPSMGPRETFKTIWFGSVRWFLENMDAYRYNVQVRDAGLIDEAVVQESTKFFEYYFAAISKGLKEGCIKPYPVELIGGFLYQDIVAVMNIISALTDEAKKKEYIGTGFDMFWDGIKAEGGDSSLRLE